MCGSDQNLDIESGAMKAHLNQLSPDGLLYFPLGMEGVPKDTSYPTVDGLTALAMLNWAKRSGNVVWLDDFKLLSMGLRKMAITVEDRAYYPPESGYGKDGSGSTTRGKANYAI